MLRDNLLLRRLTAAATTALSSKRAGPSSFSRIASPLISRPAFSSSSSSSPSSRRKATAADIAAEDGDCIYVDPTLIASQPKADTVPTLLQPRVVIYDGVCHLCHRGVKWVIKADKHAKIKFCCLQSKAAEPYMQLCGVDREDVLRRFLFIEGPGAYYEGSTAALKVASYLPLPYSTLSSLLIIPTPLRDAIYDYIAKQRYDWFGKEDECIIRKQDQELLDRFIDRDEMFGSGSNSFF